MMCSCNCVRADLRPCLHMGRALPTVRARVPGPGFSSVPTRMYRCLVCASVSLCINVGTVTGVRACTEPRLREAPAHTHGTHLAPRAAEGARHFQFLGSGMAGPSVQPT